jgi:hypothetical protein
MKFCQMREKLETAAPPSGALSEECSSRLLDHYH